MKFERLSSESQIRDLILWHNKNSDVLAIDVETTSREARKADLVDIQISGYEEGHAVIFKADYRKLLVELSPKVSLLAHNAKYDLHVLFRHGVDLLDRPFRDTLLLAHLLDENRESYSLDSFVQEIWADDYKEKFWAKYKSYEEASEEDKIDYACRDVVYTRRLYRRQIICGRAERLPLALCNHVHELQRSLLRTEIEGLEIDQDYLIALGVKLKLRIDELLPLMRESVKDEVELCELEAWGKALDLRKTPRGKAGVARPVFSFESSPQLQNLLYRKLGIPAQRNEKTKAISTDFASLERIKEVHPVVALIQENRELQKVYTAYVEGTSDRMENGRIYPEFRVAGTVTGRLAHSNPNLGQLPKTGGVRGIYRPANGCVYISADYSQLEVCIEANLTEDQALAEIFREGLSKHDITARELGVSRDAAKTLNFCLQYWGSHFKVAKLLGVSIDEGKAIWESYWDLYSGPKALKARTDRAVDSGEPLVTVFGRKRRFEKRDRSAWDGDYRQAYNFLIQSTGADITSRAFYLVSKELRARGWGRALFTVHDELLIEAKTDFITEAEQLVLSTMISVGNEIGLKIPLKAESSGPMERWED